MQLGILLHVSGTDWHTAMRALWAAMRGQYGARARELGEDVNAGWLLACGDLTPDQIRRGMERLAIAHPAWPPTAGQFVELAAGGTQQQRADEARRLEADAAARALPAPDALAGGSATGRRWLAFWRLEGLRPRPLGMSADDLDRDLERADVRGMRAMVVRERDRILRRTGIDPRDFDRATAQRQAARTARRRRTNAEIDEAVEEIAGRHESDGIAPDLATALARRALLGGRT